MLSVRAAANNVVIGSWARVKTGTYKKDVCKILAEEPNGKLRVLLVPRIRLYDDDDQDELAQEGPKKPFGAGRKRPPARCAGRPPSTQPSVLGC